MVYALCVSTKPSTMNAQDITISPIRTAFMFRVIRVISVCICLSPIFPGSYRPFPPIETAPWGSRTLQVQEAGQTPFLIYSPGHTERVSHFYVIKRKQVTECEESSWRADLRGRGGVCWGGLAGEIVPGNAPSVMLTDHPHLSTMLMP